MPSASSPTAPVAAPPVNAPPVTVLRGADAPALASALAASITVWRATHGVLAPVDVLVEHRAMRSWLTLELASLLGVCAGVTFRFPSTLGVIHEAPLGAGLVGRIDDALGALLASPAAPEATGVDDPFIPVRAFVMREAAPERQRLRRFLLAERIGRTFERYAAHWPDALERWSRDEEAGDERWQAALWRAIASPAAAAASPLPPPATTAGAPLFVFDVATPGLDLVRAVGRHPGPVTLLARDAPPIDVDDPWLRHGALRAHGHARWSVLAPALAADVAPASASSARALPGLEVLACPSHRRACEAVVARLWAWVREARGAEPLRFHEIGIAIPAGQRDALLPVLRDAMREAHDVPKVLWRVPLAAHNSVAMLARALVEVFGGPLRRAELFGLLRHPLFPGHAAAERGDARAETDDDTWLEWLDATGVYHGLDDEDLQHTYLAGQSAAHWDQALTRLALGAFMGGARSGPASSLRTPSGTFLPEERTQSLQPEVGGLLVRLRSLLMDAAAARRAALPLDAWVHLWRAVFATYVAPTTAHERRALAAVQRATDELRALGLVGDVPFAVVQEALLDALDALAGDGGGHFGQGVLVGTPEELRGLPFRRLVVLGLEAGSFPARSVRDEIDLRPDDRALLDDVRRRDGAAFYDLVTSTTEGVTLAYLARDPVSAERLRPSLLLSDLDTHLRWRGPDGGRGALLDDDTARVEAQVPLLRRMEAGEDIVAWAFPEARAEAAVAQLGEALVARCDEAPGMRDVPAGWRPLLRAEVPPPAPATDGGVIELTLEDIVRFLECPVQGHARVRLKIYQGGEDRGALIDEPFELSALTRHTLLNDTFAALFTASSPLELKNRAVLEERLTACLSEVMARLVAQGEVPVGALQTHERRMYLNQLRAAAGIVVDTLADVDTRARQVCWGRSLQQQGRHMTPLEPVERVVTLQGAPRTVRVSGTSSLLFDDDTRIVWIRSSLRTTPSTWATALMKKRALHAWVEHLMLQLSTVPRERKMIGVDGGTWVDTAVWPDTPQELAGATLDTILVDLLAGPIGARAPAVACFLAWNAMQGAADHATRRHLFEEACEAAYDPWNHIESGQFHPIPDVDTLPLPDDDVLDTVLERLRPYMEAWRHETTAAEDEDTSTTASAGASTTTRKKDKAPSAAGRKKARTGGGGQ